jgi:xylulokinase
MANLMGIDLGTSSVKAVLTDIHGQILAVHTCEYCILTPRSGYAEQQPEDWWNATCRAVRAVCAATATHDIAAIGFSGQMHGTVLIDTRHHPIGNAIIWADQRSVDEVALIVETIGQQTLVNTTGTLPATGFMAATLVWLLRHDPSRLDSAISVLLPKDYLRLKLTGTIGTDTSDASSTGLFNIHDHRWASDIIRALKLPETIFPTAADSSEVIGTLTHDAAQMLGIPVGIPVVAGCADQAAQAVGNGLFNSSTGSITIGTGGQLMLPCLDSFTDPQMRLHTFCHAVPDRWYLLGAMLAAGLSLRWLRSIAGMGDDPQAYERLSELASEVQPGADGLLFLPYLVGERAPVLDANATGAFARLRLHHGLGHMVRAVMEGVAFNFRQIQEIMEEMNAPLERLVVSGGGFNSTVWSQIIADTLGLPLYLTPDGERAGVGAALLAGKGTGIIQRFEAPTLILLTEPITEHTEHYTASYKEYVQLYPLLKQLL